MTGRHRACRRPGAQCHRTKNAATHGVGQPSQIVDCDVRIARIGLLCPEVECIGVGSEQVGGAAERLDDTRSQRLLEHRKYVVSHPRARKRRVVVGRVVPRLESAFVDGRAQRDATEPEQRPHVVASNRGHPRQRTTTGAARKSEQHGLCLVIKGVAEEYACCSDARCGRIKGVVARPARIVFRPLAGDRNHVDGIGTEAARTFADSSRALSRVRCPTVVNDDRTGTKASARCFECRRGE
jgi:hypothetical protein